MFNPRIERLERVLEGVIKVPAPNASDYGKVPMVNSDGDYELEDLPKEVPEPAIADEGKVIGVDASGEYALVNIPNEVPTPAVADEGKVIGVNSNGEYALVESSSSGYVVDLPSDAITIDTADEANGYFIINGNVSQQVAEELCAMVENKPCWIHTGAIYYDNDESSYLIDDGTDVYFMINGIGVGGYYMTSISYYNDQAQIAMATGLWDIGNFGDNTTPTPINPLNS